MFFLFVALFIVFLVLKFYLNKVDGSFDESLHMLIHRIMYVENKHVIGSNDPDEDLNCYYRMFVGFDLFDEIHIDDLRDLDPVTIDMFGDIEMVVRIGSLINIVTNII